MLVGGDWMILHQNIINNISDFCYNLRDCGFCPFNRDDNCSLYSDDYGIPEKWRNIIDGKGRDE